MSEPASVYSLNIPSRWTLRAGASLIVDGDRHILVDSGYFETQAELNESLEASAGITLAEITDLYYTHLHYDHYRPLRSKRKMRVHIPEVEYRFINELMQHRRDRQSFCAFLQETHEVIAPVFLRQFFNFANDSRYQWNTMTDAGEIYLCRPGMLLSEHVRTVDLPGHCPGQLGLEIRTDHGIGMIAGDAVICLRDFTAADTDHHLIVHNRQKLLQSRRRVAQADFVIPGHGAWFDPVRRLLVTFQESMI